MNREEAEDRGYSPGEMYDDPPVELELSFGDLTQEERTAFRDDLASAREMLDELLEESERGILVSRMALRVGLIGEFLMAAGDDLEEKPEYEDLASEALTVGERNPTLAQESRRG